ncbi:MAG: hypothetical protein GX088_05350 [Clostridia bacterium]|nr:hypothetical protein [Clostridia bacterium]
MSQGAKITAENLRLEEIIFSYNSPESFLKGLDTCERLVSEVNLIFAEYILEKSKIPSDDVKKVKDLWERVKNIMNEKLRIAEENLDKVYATKLDIAKLIVSVTQLAGEADKEMLVLKENIEQDLNLIHKKI